MPTFVIQEYCPLIDSSNMAPSHWQMIADDIQANYDKYDGFVILHGTDTMAFTASALSFMLQDLGKPVIVTGSQIPLSQLRSDGQTNLLNALYIAANYPVAEVCLFFNNKLFRGNRTTKPMPTASMPLPRRTSLYCWKPGSKFACGPEKLRRPAISP